MVLRTHGVATFPSPPHPRVHSWLCSQETEGGDDPHTRVEDRDKIIKTLSSKSELSYIRLTRGILATSQH